MRSWRLYVRQHNFIVFKNFLKHSCVLGLQFKQSVKASGPLVEILHISCFPLTPMLKFQKCHKLLIFLADNQNIRNFIFPYDCRIYHKVWPRSDENCTRSSILKFPAPYGPVLTWLTKISKCHKFFTFWQIGKNSYSVNSLVTNILTIKFGWTWMKTGGAVAFWKS